MSATPLPPPDLEQYYRRQIEWSGRTFGPGRRT